MDQKDRKVVLFSRRVNSSSSKTAPAQQRETFEEEEWGDEPWENPEAWKQVYLEPECAVTETELPAAVAVQPAPGKKVKKKKSAKKRLIITGSVIVVLVLLYLAAMFSNIPFIKKYREMYIGTALDTYTHKWVLFFVPTVAIDEVIAEREAFSLWQQQNAITVYPSATPAPAVSGAKPSSAASANPSQSKSDAENVFYTKFYMLDKASFTDYASKNSDVLKNGYDKLLINETALDKKGTTIKTTQGDQVLAVDSENGILIVKVAGSDYQGKLAIIRNAAQVRLGVSNAIGSSGQPVGDIAKANHAVLAINASGFADPNGNGRGGNVVGLCISGGKQYNKALGQGYLPIGFGSDNLLYIGVSTSKMKYRDAVEFMPALIVNGKDFSAAAENFAGIQPRSVIGQAKDGTVFLLTIDGRQPGWSLGAPVVTCTKLLLKYGAIQAANLDGGSSTIMIYRDEIITKTSGVDKYGRLCPDAFIVDYMKNVKDNSVG